MAFPRKGTRRLVVDGTANDLSLGQAQADAALAGPTRLTLRGAERDGLLTIEQAVVDNARLNATAQGIVGAGQTDVTAQLRADSLAFLGRGIGGAVAASARLTASRSFQGTTTVAAVCAAITPGLPGTPSVASPEPASASRPSEPDRVPPMISATMMRPVMPRVAARRRLARALAALAGPTL